MNSKHHLVVLAACGLAGGLASVATAQPYVVNISGATLQQNFFTAPASTNDFIDVNGDGLSRTSPSPAVQNLAPNSNLVFASPYPTAGPIGATGKLHWIVQYRTTGSVNGFIELTRFGGASPVVDTPGNPAADTDAGLIPRFLSPTGGGADQAWSNTLVVFNNTANPPTTSGLYNPANPGGWPVRSRTDGSFVAAPFVSGAPSTGGTSIDIAPLDVPSSWAVAIPGPSAPGLTPTQPGYGANPRVAVNKDGSPTTFDNLLASLNGRNLFNPSAAPDANTIFDTPTAFTPVAGYVNYGVRHREMDMAALRHLFGTGRLPNGENLVAITRDAGSGTRNAWQNSIGQDPAWGVGENVGAQNSLANQQILGPDWLPSNKTGSGAMEGTVRHHRLAVGYSGAERGVGSGASLLQGNLTDILAIRADGGTDFVRPHIDRVLENGFRGQMDPSTGSPYAVDGYRIGGPAILATICDPRAVGPALGGEGGCGRADFNSSGSIEVADIFAFLSAWFAGNPAADFDGSGGVPVVSDIFAFLSSWFAGCSGGNAHPAMANQQAAAYINNITRSLESVTAFPAGAVNDFSPGELIANTFILPAATDRIQGLNAPQTWNSNDKFSQAVQDFTRANNKLSDARFLAFNATNTGFGPSRKAGVTYNDGVAGGVNYTDQAGAPVSYSSPVNARNRVAGDFNNDGVRDINDAAELVAAWRDRTNYDAGVWQAGTPAVIEQLGDFTGDGGFDAEDARYFADGLALTGVNPASFQPSGVLNRKAGFAALDNALGAQTAGADANLFNTTKATGAAYVPGDSRADVASAARATTRGFNPTADGVINAADIDYVFRQFKNPNIAGAADWSDLNEAVRFDLSADINGDLRVDAADVCEIVVCVLGTTFRDRNLDGQVTATDTASLPPLGTTNIGWAQGDVDGDGVLTQADLDVLNGTVQVSCPTCN